MNFLHRLYHRPLTYTSLHHTLFFTQGLKTAPISKMARKKKKSRSPRDKKAASYPPLSTFFYLFPDFTRNTSIAPEADFRRLQQSHDWLTPVYNIFRRAFLLALAVETKSPVHEFFASRTAFLEYDSTASPHVEFRRLQDQLGRLPSDAEYREDHKLFLNAFNREFNSPLDSFYREFGDFEYNPRAPPMAEFRRLMGHKGWRPRPREHQDAKSRKYNHARNRFFEVFRNEFTRHFGGDEDVRTWQGLCVTLGVLPIPESKDSCSKVLSPLMVNIYDLVHHKRTGEAFDFFKTLEDLSEYSIKNNLIYPKKRAKEGPFRFLLRKILMGDSERREPARQVARPTAV